MKCNFSEISFLYHYAMTKKQIFIFINFTIALEREISSFIGTFLPFAHQGFSLFFI